MENFDEFEVTNESQILSSEKLFAMFGKTATPKEAKPQKGQFENDKYSGLNLYNFDFTELPKLIDPIFPKVGVVSLVGSSDTGKSTFLRQMALSIAFNFDEFLG